MVGDQQQPPVRQRLAVPLRTIGRRQELGRIAEAEAPLVFLPAAVKIAAQQRGLGNAEMGAGVRPEPTPTAPSAGSRGTMRAASIVIAIGGDMAHRFLDDLGRGG